MSKKIAGGAGAIALDVKAGAAGSSRTRRRRAAAELMASLAEPWGRRVRWTVTSMGQPLGRCVGNALEVREAGEVLRGGGAPDVRELAVRWRRSSPRPRGSRPAARGPAPPRP